MTTTTATSKAIKTVVVLAVYIWNHIARVCYKVRSSDGVGEYHTCFEMIDGVMHESCTCPGNAQYGKRCYHISGLAERAAAKIAARVTVNARIDAIVEETRNVAPRQQEDWSEPELTPAQRRAAYSDMFDVHGLNL